MDFKAKSFASSENTEVLAVQFIIKTGSMYTAPVEIKNKSAWEKFMDLFK